MFLPVVLATSRTYHSEQYLLQLQACGNPYHPSFDACSICCKYRIRHKLLFLQTKKVSILPAIIVVPFVFIVSVVIKFCSRSSDATFDRSTRGFGLLTSDVDSTDAFQIRVDATDRVHVTAVAKTSTSCCFRHVLRLFCLPALQNMVSDFHVSLRSRSFATGLEPFRIRLSFIFCNGILVNKCFLCLGITCFFLLRFNDLVGDINYLANTAWLENRVCRKRCRKSSNSSGGLVLLPRHRHIWLRQRRRRRRRRNNNRTIVAVAIFRRRRWLPVGKVSQRQVLCICCLAAGGSLFPSSKRTRSGSAWQHFFASFFFTFSVVAQCRAWFLHCKAFRVLTWAEISFHLPYPYISYTSRC